MGDARRWSVTYTRHLKQKRKVYQDGALELHLSTNKLVLYDDSGKIVESKFLNKDELIESGGTLAFDAHLVDIGEIERNCMQLTDVNIQERDSMGIKKASVLAQKNRHSSSVENTKVKLQNIGASEKHQNMIHNAARVNKKGQLHASGATQTTLRGWHALYTTQITQKTKKYHDGILQLSFCGSHGKQVMLYDDSWKLIDSRFLRKDETVEPGGTLAFVAHLVEIGEPEETHKPLMDLNVQERDVKSNEKTWMQGQQSLPAENKKTKLQQNGTVQNCPVAAKNSGKNELQETEASNSHLNITDNSFSPSCAEWHVLYTSQLTQKAKKYHDGILRLSCDGSHGKKVILLSEDGRILSSKYIKSSEKVRTGTAYGLPSYLVNVGEQRTSQGGDLEHNISSGPVVSKSSGSNVSRFIIREKAEGNKLLRDASQILSILKKPSTGKSIDHTERLIEQTCCTHSLDFVESFVQHKLPGQNLHGLKDPKKNADGGRDEVRNPEEENMTETGTSKSGRDLQLVSAIQQVLFPECTNSMDHGHGQKPSAEGYSAIIDADSGTAVLDISEAESDMKHIGESVTHLAASVDPPQVSVIITSDLSKDGQSQKHSSELSTSSNGVRSGNIASMELLDCLKEDEQVQGNLGFFNLEGEHHDEGSVTGASSWIPAEMDVPSKPSHGALQILEEAKHTSGKQVSAGDAALYNQRLKEALSSVSSLNFSGAAHDAKNAGKEKSDDFEGSYDKSGDNEDIPSFDLGI